MLFTLVIVVIVLLGLVAILLTVEGAMSGRNLTLGLLLAGGMLVLQGGALAYSAMNPPASASDSPAAPAADAQPSPTPESS